jgi:hypothetical protein
MPSAQPSIANSNNNMPTLRSQAEFFMGGVVPIHSHPSNCPICLEPQTADVILITACGHAFHLVCVLTWFQSRFARHRSCPTCRRELYGPKPVRPSGNTPARREIQDDQDDFEAVLISPRPTEESRVVRPELNELRNDSFRDATVLPRANQYFHGFDAFEDEAAEYGRILSLPSASRRRLAPATLRYLHGGIHSPRHSPAFPGVVPTEPENDLSSPTSPTYTPTSPHHESASPQYRAISPRWSTTSPRYVPLSPTLNNAPVWTPTSPTYAPS